jgi:cell division protein FtsI/penicillin-binding protein 2
MIRAARWTDSASGIRPMAAFVLIGAVLLLVGGKVGWVALREGRSKRPKQQLEVGSPLAFAMTDRQGRTLAHFVQRLDLVASPNALWQAHTPESLCRALSAALGGAPDPLELFRRLTPDAGSDDVVRTALRLDRPEAERVAQWLARGHFRQEEPASPVHGLWLERAADGRALLAWKPVLALSARARASHFDETRPTALRWTARLCDGLLRAVLGAQAYRELALDGEALASARRDLWDQLMPSTWRVAVRGFEPQRASEVARILSAEGVAWHQLHVGRERDRSYPTGWHPLWGRWGFPDQEQLAREALSALGESGAESMSREQLGRAVARLEPDRLQAYERLCRAGGADPRPMTGLERAWGELLSGEPFDWLDSRGAAYLFERHRPALAPSRSYYLESVPEAEVPRVQSTLDLALQHFLGVELERTLAEHDAALAMGIAIDAANGEVLAVDSRERYRISGFAPVVHTFTPGSTFKVIAMTSALDAGVVEPDEVLDTGNGREYRFEGRVVHEAEHSPGGRLSAAQCLAFSANAGLVQIVTRVDATRLRAYFRALRYAEAPSTGLGGERAGTLPALPWKRAWAHASVAYGHELHTTLWQHAAALAAVVRGGEWTPLVLMDSVRQGARAVGLERGALERVFSPQACLEARAMMELGARVGTGKFVASLEQMPDLVVGTKTGTAQKVPGEVCLHVELAHQAEHRRAGTRCPRACRARLGSDRPGHRECYTSSMCMWGRTHDSEREVLVLVVVEEPRGMEKYGSRVSGPLAAKLLREALGQTSMGQPLIRASVGGFLPMDSLAAKADDPASPSKSAAGRTPQGHDAPSLPWAEVPQ